MPCPSDPPPSETGHSDVTTRGVRVRVGAQYLPQRSHPEDGHWFYAYRVAIRNLGEQTVKLLSRHWIVRDADGETTEVRGQGVVGEQPELAPGGSYEYVSGCPLQTTWGTMEGSYRMLRDDGELFDARIGRFTLAQNVAPLSDLPGSRPAARVRAARRADEGGR